MSQAFIEIFCCKFDKAMSFTGRANPRLINWLAEQAKEIAEYKLKKFEHEQAEPGNHD